MKFTTRQICYIAIMTAITGALSILSIPTPWGVPFTLQTFCVALCGYLLGRRDGTIAILLYIVIGTIGVPVFAGFSSGPGVIAGPSGGYIIGFIFMAFLCGFGSYFYEKVASNKILGMILAVVFGLIGLAVCHGIGIVQLKNVAKLDWVYAASVGSVPYLLKDIISTVGAFAISIVLKRALSAAHLWEQKSVSEA